MKTFEEVRADLQNVRKAITEAEAKEKTLVDSYIELEDIKERIEQKKAVEAELRANTEHIKNMKLCTMILKSNAKIALFNDVMPIAVEVLAKYAGKPYGDKTREKICDEVRAKTNCRFYIDCRYNEYTYRIYPNVLYNYDLTCGAIHASGEKLLKDNKIQAVPLEHISLFYDSREYVENIMDRIIELKSMYDRAVQKQKELDEICTAFNALAVGDIPHIYKDKHIYENMMI